MLSITPEDTRKLIRTVRTNYNIDLSEFCFNLLRYRVSRYLNIHQVKGIDKLADLLLEDETCLDEFLSEISAGSSELFRDPEMWKHLRVQFIPELFSRSNQPVFWLPRSVSGHDAFSLLILLGEEGLIPGCLIVSSTLSFTGLKGLQSGKLDKSFMNLNRENYLNSGGKRSLVDYLDRGEDCLSNSLTGKIRFTRQVNMLFNAPDRADLVLIRNQLLNYTEPVKNHLLNNITEILQPGGILVLGVKELIGDGPVGRQYDPLVQELGIYRKRIRVTKMDKL